MPWGRLPTCLNDQRLLIEGRLATCPTKPTHAQVCRRHDEGGLRAGAGPGAESETGRVDPFANLRVPGQFPGRSCILAEDWSSLRALLDDCARLAKEQGIAHSGDLIGITAGLPEQELGTNMFEVHRVP